MGKTLPSYKTLAVIIILSSLINMLCSTQQNDKAAELKIDSILEEFNSSGSPGAAVMAIKDGKTVFQKGYGLDNPAANTKINEYTNFRLASVSKQFTAMCIMILKESGGLSYENSLKDIFPDFPEYGKNITIKNLLNHTSGLIDYEDIMPDTQTVQVHDNDVLDMMMSIDSTYFPAGEKYKYSNSGYTVLAMIVEKVSGKRYADFLKDNIFNPLKMNGTVAYEKGVSDITNRALGYVQRENGFAERDQSSTSAVLGDGGIYCSLEDYKKWDAALYTDKIVSQETLKDAFTQTLLNDETVISYGFGWETSFIDGVNILEHNGSTCGFTNHVIRIPGKKLTVVILTNRYGVQNITEYCTAITNIFADDLFKNDTRKKDRY
jgi:CubicO group peptidase (beta-lactamase class C family)